jgi:hypothetical protein
MSARLGQLRASTAKGAVFRRFTPRGTIGQTAIAPQAPLLIELARSSGSFAEWNRKRLSAQSRLSPWGFPAGLRAQRLIAHDAFLRAGAVADELSNTAQFVPIRRSPGSRLEWLEQCGSEMTQLIPIHALQ